MSHQTSQWAKQGPLVNQFECMYWENDHKMDEMSTSLVQPSEYTFTSWPLRLLGHSSWLAQAPPIPRGETKDWIYGAIYWSYFFHSILWPLRRAVHFKRRTLRHRSCGSITKMKWPNSPVTDQYKPFATYLVPLHAVLLRPIGDRLADSIPPVRNRRRKRFECLLQ